MIGAYVLNLSLQKPDRVTKISEHYVKLAEGGLTHIVLIDPIPLTADFLADNGFEKRSLWCLKDNFIYHFGQSFLLYCNSDNVFFTITAGVVNYIRYVHELQQVLRLCHMNIDIIINPESILTN